MLGPSPFFPGTGSGAGLGAGGSPGFVGRDVIWVDLRFASGVGNNGTDELPFNTANIGLAAVPAGGTLVMVGGDASSEAGVNIAARSFAAIGLGGQTASGGLTPVLPTLTYAITTGTQRLAFHNISATIVHSGTSAGLTSFYFEFCPSITLTGGTDTAPVTWVGADGCIFSGAGGAAVLSGGTVAGYVANGSGSITVDGCNITGSLTSSVSITLLNACSFGAVSVTAPTITIDDASYKTALTAGVTFSTTPIRLAATAAPSDIGTANTEGTGNKGVRNDHGHKLPFSTWNAVAATADATIDINGQKITGSAAPTSGTDLINKTYADALAGGLKVKTPAVAVATANQATMTGQAQTIDGVALNTIGQRVLLTAQTTATQNGLWLIASGAWTRPTDFAIGSSAAQSYVLITGGTLGAGSSYFCTSTAGSDVVDTNNLAWALFSQSASVTAGAGLTKTGNTLDVIAADATIVVNADSLQVGVVGSANFANNTIAPARLTNATAQGDFLMRVSSGSGAWEDGTTAQARSALGLFQVASWQPVRAATTANITLSGTQTVDGVALIANERCLVKNQTTGSQNGIYVVAAGAWSRATDAATSSQFFGGMIVAVSEGTANGDRVAMLTTNDPITVGSTTLTFAMDRIVAVTSTAPSDVTKAAASIGTSEFAARTDHKHDILTAAPSDIGSANAEGSSTAVARADHIHNLTAAVVGALITAGAGLTLSVATLDVVAGDATIVVSANDIKVGVVQTANIANDAVTYAKLQNVSTTSRFLGRITASAGDAEELTGTQATTLLDAFTSSLKGLAPASGGGSTNYLRADGTWAAPPGTAISIATDTLMGRDTAGTGSYEAITVGGGLEFTGSLSIQRSALTGDVTASAGSGSTTIAAGAVTLAKMANIATDTLIGRDTASTGVPEAITVTGGIVFSGSGSIQTTAFTGDVTKTLGGTALTIANDAVTYAKMQNVSATSRILGRITSGAGDVEELTGSQVTGLLAAPGSTLQLIYNNAGAFDGASGITIVGSETALAFGATPAASGNIRGTSGFTIYHNNGSGVDRRVFEGSGETQSFGGLAGTGDRYWDAGDGGTHHWRDGNGGSRSLADLNHSSGLDMLSHAVKGVTSLSFSGTPATVGSLRLANGGQGYGRSTVSTNLYLFGVEADNGTYYGDPSSAAMYLRTGAGLGLRLGGSGTDSASFTTSTLDLKSLTITQGTNPSTAGDFRTKNIYSWTGRNYDNSGNVNIVGLGGDGSTFTDLSVGDAGSKGNNSLYVSAKAQLVLTLSAGQTHRFDSAKIFIANTSAAPGDPTSGGHLYSESGAGKWRGTSGTVTTFGPAEPHCPRCDRDFAHEWESKKYGKLSVCMWCLTNALELAGVPANDFVIERKAG